MNQCGSEHSARLRQRPAAYQSASTSTFPPACLLACLPAAVRLYADSYVNEEALATLVALSGICVVIALAPGTKAHLACTPVSIQMAFDELTALTSKVLDAAPIFRSPVPAQAR